MGDQFGSQHGLAVPFGGLVDGDFGTLFGGAVGWILEGAVEVDVFAGCAGAVDIVLVGADGRGEGPFVEVGGGGHVVKAAIPDNGSWIDISGRTYAVSRGGLPADAAPSSADRMVALPNILNEWNVDRDQLYQRVDGSNEAERKNDKSEVKNTVQSHRQDL